MGTGSHEEVDIRIKGYISFDYEEMPYRHVVFKFKLDQLCQEYGLDVHYNPIKGE